VHEARWVVAVLGKAAGCVAAKPDDGRAEKRFAAEAVETGEAREEWIGCNAVANRDVLYITASRDNRACCFVA
jgi:hypothetical protein